jgi:riboflavin kinase / FMN adenylyltransferase
MRVLFDLKSLRKERGPIVLAAGFFDGVHRGHRKVIRRALAKAKQTGGRAWVLTFDPHPLDVLKPGAAPLLLTSNRHKLMLLDQLGISGCLLLSFTRTLAALEPDAFCALLRRSIPSFTELVVGKNWRFGRFGKGNRMLLAKLGRKMGFRVTIVSPSTRRGEAISSTRIRNRVIHGDFSEASIMLGRPFSVLGTVVRGRAVGRKIGFPTANLDPHSEALPPSGVYAVLARVGGKMREGVLNLGVRPTFIRNRKRNAKSVMELHLFGFDRSLYGCDVEVFFVKRLREEKRFGSQAALVTQISRDIANARFVLRKRRIMQNRALA